MNWVKQGEDWIFSLIIALAAALFINIFVLQHIIVEGHSMDPSLHDHEHVIVSKLSHTVNRMPDYGDIVVVDSRTQRPRSIKDDLAEPINNWITQQNYVYIKRVIGKPNDVLEFKEGRVYRNGVLLEESYIKEPMNEITYRKITVPENSVFVMGDNRNNSNDSRFIGSIPLNHVLGILFVKL